MRFAINSCLSFLAFCCAALAVPLLAIPLSVSARADGAFIEQAGRAAVTRGHMVSSDIVPVQRTAARLPSRVPAYTPPPELLTQSGGNYASTLQIGQYNRVFQAQAGSNNYSNVGIIKGAYNNVGVLQAGHSLRSNLLLVNTAGLSVGVIQPNGSAPINMLIARLPNGGLLIKR
jgi:hypothetical protein